MAREKEDYRAIYENLLEHFGGKRILNRSEIARYLGIDARTVARLYGVGSTGIAIEKLARLMA
ncbi:MAG: hypothetical protein Q4A83_07485 [Bacillota bacterium]|nr:hypothetical protein [Bacillota bacterium]